MAYSDLFRLSSHAVITNERDEVLLLKANYGDFNWGLPGGALDPAETVHDALNRECLEELNCEVIVRYLSGIYYHSAYNSQVFIFRCELNRDAKITLSEEHSEHKFTPLEALPKVQRIRVSDCLSFDNNFDIDVDGNSPGNVITRKF